MTDFKGWEKKAKVLVEEASDKEKKEKDQANKDLGINPDEPEYARHLSLESFVIIIAAIVFSEIPKAKAVLDRLCTVRQVMKAVSTNISVAWLYLC